MNDAAAATKSSTKHSGYFRATRSATFSFLAVLPLLLAYEVLILVVNDGTDAPVRVGADVWIKQLIAAIGGTGMFALGIAVLAVGIVVVYRDRARPTRIRPAWFGLMLFESLLYAVIIALAVSSVVQGLFAGMAGVQESLGLGRLLALSLGAGLYEELIFRVVLVGGLAWMFGLRSDHRRRNYVAAALIGAFVFSAVHYIGALGDVFTVSSFTFRFLFGLALNALFLTRGFGITAWTHAIYDVLVVTSLLG